MGLVTADEFKKARVLAETGVGDKEGGAGGEGGEGAGGAEDAATRKKKKRKKKKLISTLSFGEEIEQDDEAEGGKSGGGFSLVACFWVLEKVLTIRKSRDGFAEEEDESSQQLRKEP